MIQTIKTLLMRQDELVARSKMEAALAMFPMVLFAFSPFFFFLRHRRPGHGGFCHHNRQILIQSVQVLLHSEHKGGLTFYLPLVREALDTTKKIKLDYMQSIKSRCGRSCG